MKMHTGLKTGIITFHQALNYGAALQTYALQRTIKELNADCEVIDYACRRINEDYKSFRFDKCRSKGDYVRMVRFASRVNKRRRKFSGFLKRYLTLSPECDASNISEVAKRYDCFITGSDQVFNDKCTDLDVNYFLDFIDKDNNDATKNSYAASFGFKEIPKGLEDTYNRLLSSFDNISVREKSGIDIVSKAVGENGRQAVQNVDPTLALNETQWREIVGERPLDKPYIFMYTVMEAVHGFEYAARLAEEKNMTLIYLHGTIELREKSKNEKNIKHIYSLSPDEFVTYLYHAEYVVTNSFHGTVFSVIFKKKFMAELETGWNYNHRSEELLKQLGLDRHILKDMDMAAIEVTDNWEVVDEYLGLESDRTKQYLQTIVCPVC